MGRGETTKLCAHSPLWLDTGKLPASWRKPDTHSSKFRSHHSISDWILSFVPPKPPDYSETGGEMQFVMTFQECIEILSVRTTCQKELLGCAPRWWCGGGPSGSTCLSISACQCILKAERRKLKSQEASCSLILCEFFWQEITPVTQTCSDLCRIINAICIKWTRKHNLFSRSGADRSYTELGDILRLPLIIMRDNLEDYHVTMMKEFDSFKFLP